MADLIRQDLEFTEVLNAFPVLKERLSDLHLEVDDVKEGETVRDYLEKHSFSSDEIDLLVKKLNTEVKYFLKNGEKPSLELEDEEKVLEDPSTTIDEEDYNYFSDAESEEE